MPQHLELGHLDYADQQVVHQAVRDEPFQQRGVLDDFFSKDPSILIRRKELTLFIGKLDPKIEQTKTTTPTTTNLHLATPAGWIGTSTRTTPQQLNSSTQHQPVGLGHQPKHTQLWPVGLGHQREPQLNLHPVGLRHRSGLPRTPSGRIGTSTRATTTYNTVWNFFFVF